MPGQTSKCLQWDRYSRTWRHRNFYPFGIGPLYLTFLAASLLSIMLFGDLNKSLIKGNGNDIPRSFNSHRAFINIPPPQRYFTARNRPLARLTTASIQNQNLQHLQVGVVDEQRELVVPLHACLAASAHLAKPAVEIRHNNNSRQY